MSTIWQQSFTIESLNTLGLNTLSEALGIRFTRFDHNSIEAVMPVKEANKQPFGILHGGATAALAETIGSVASYLCVPGPEPRSVGIELNINHLNSVSDGSVRALCQPVKLGRRIHVWNIEIYDDTDLLLSVSRLTTLVKNLQTE